MAISPKVWVLLGTERGDNGQLTSLADALGWPYETKQLVYNPLNRCPNLLLGASLISLDRRKSSPLTAPWPDLVIAASRHSVPVALWLKKRSGGRTRLVHLMYAQAPLDWFDLLITTPQYCLPPRPNVLHNTAPLNRIAPDRLAAAASLSQTSLGLILHCSSAETVRRMSWTRSPLRTSAIRRALRPVRSMAHCWSVRVRAHLPLLPKRCSQPSTVQRIAIAGARMTRTILISLISLSPTVLLLPLTVPHR